MALMPLVLEAVTRSAGGQSCAKTERVESIFASVQDGFGHDCLEAIHCFCMHLAGCANLTSMHVMIMMLMTRPFMLLRIQSGRPAQDPQMQQGEAQSTGQER